jgi:transcriptional regulator with PAS, ATPase and Fis domain
VNCASLPDDLIESELFGYEKGAFTGADTRKPGRFELANRGTLFLDEVGDLPPLTQTKLLRFLEEKTFERLGASETVSVDVRIIAATNKNLEKQVKKGTFREDLYYRLNVIPVVLPPLRSRVEDIPLFIDAFTHRFNDQLGTNVTFGEEAVKELLGYNFPGNVRELLNVVERCIALSSNKAIGRSDLPPHVLKNKHNKIPLLSLQQVSAEAEKDHILKILKVTKGNRSQAAEVLGVSRKTLWEKIKNFDLDV